MSTRMQQMLVDREAATARITSILTTTSGENRKPLTDSEQKEIVLLRAKLDDLTPAIERIQSMNTIRSTFGPTSLLDKPEGRALPGTANTPSPYADVEQFIRTGHVADSLRPGISASLSEGADLGVAIPPFQLETFRIASPFIAPFENAGATIFASDSFGMTKIKVPFVLSGSAVTTFAEEAGPSSTQDASVVGIELDSDKYAFLTKISEESDADIANLGGAVTVEGLRRVYKSTSDAATAALLDSLIDAGAWITRGSDNLKSLLDLESAINPVYSSPTNCLMLSRLALSELRNTRDLQDRPIFDPVSRTFLGYRAIINDALGGHVVFGNFGEGAFLSYSQLVVQRLLEAYREDGQIGIRFARRMASAFFSDASSGSVQPLYSLNLDVAGS